MSKQTKDERLAEVSRATIDAHLLGCGFLMILPDNSFKHVPVEDIYLKPKHTAEQQSASGSEGKP